MKKKKMIYSLGFVLILVAIASYFILKTQNKEMKEHAIEHVYTCPMHPQISKSQPGNCPICGMDLVLKKPELATEKEDDLKFLLKPTNQFVIGDFNTITPKDTSVFEEVTFPGEVTYDDETISIISARVSGRIEKMYVKYPSQKIKKGQKIFEIYSPELLTMQDNYIYLLKNDEQNTSLIASAKNKLALYGMTTAQIQALTQTKKTNPIVVVYSSEEGIVEEIGKTKNGNMEMNIETETLSFHEGSYVKKDMPIFRVINTNKVWGVFSVLQGYSDLLKLGKAVFISSETNSAIIQTAKIDFIEAALNKKEKTNTFRVYLENKKDQLPIGSRLKGTIFTNSVKGLFIPKSAYITLGNRKVVFLEKKNGFVAKEIMSGFETSQLLQVTGGLSIKDQIAEYASYLMDSESFIKTKNNEEY